MMNTFPFRFSNPRNGATADGLDLSLGGGSAAFGRPFSRFETARGALQWNVLCQLGGDSSGALFRGGAGCFWPSHRRCGLFGA